MMHAAINPSAHELVIKPAAAFTQYHAAAWSFDV